MQVPTRYKQGFKCTLLLSILIGFSFSIKAQKFEGGLFGGLTTSQVNGDGLSGFDIFGPQLGAFTFIPLKEKSTLHFEIAYKQKGAREPASDTSNFYSLRVNYINLPLLYTYSFSDQLSFEIGPAVDIFVSATEEDIGGERTDSPYPFYAFNLAGLGGLRFNFSEQWWVTFRSSISITPTRKGTRNGRSPYIISAGGAGHRNVVLSTGLYYKF